MLNRRAENLLVASSFLNRLAEGDVDGAVAMTVDDVSMTIPFEIPGLPQQLDGHEMLRGFLSHSTALFELPFSLRVTAEHPVAGGDGWILEYRCQARLADATGVYQNTYVGIFDFADGKVARWKEFPNPLPILELLGRSQVTPTPRRD